MYVEATTCFPRISYKNVLFFKRGDYKGDDPKPVTLLRWYPLYRIPPTPPTLGSTSILHYFQHLETSTPFVLSSTHTLSLIASALYLLSALLRANFDNEP